VIRKKSVEKLGAGNLAQMNAKGYASGGIVDLKGQRGGGSAVANTVIKNQKGKNIGLAEDSYTSLGGNSVKVPIAKSRYDKLKRQGLGWEKWLLTKEGSAALKKAGVSGSLRDPSSDSRFPVDYIDGSGNLYDAKDKGFRNFGGSPAKQAIAKALNYKLFKAFGPNYNYTARSNKIGVRGDSAPFLGGQLTTGQDNINVKPATFLYPDIKTRAQKLALGGIVNANKVGAAVLEGDKGAKTDSIKVGINDVKPFIPGSGFDKDKAQKRFGKVTGFTGKSYTLAKQGLNQTTSDNFSKVLFDETAEGVDRSVQQLSNDLGLGSISLGNKNVLSDSLRTTGIVGALFESTLNTLQNRGDFSPEAANAPFDFPRGLSGTLADNYSNLPSAWIDAKSSFKEASAKAFKTKIAREISDEYVRSGDYDKAVSGEGFATGGSVSDTVPAMLTPGEFVFSKKAADGIGRANLDRMNKQGVQGFARGGNVKRFATAGPVSGGGGGLRLGEGEFGGFGDLVTVLREAKDSIETLAEANDELAVKISSAGKLSPSDTSRATPTQVIARSGGPGGGPQAGADLQNEFAGLQDTIKANIKTLKVLQQSSKTTEGNQAQLSDIIKVYGRFLRQGQTSTQALQSTSDALQSSIQATSGSYSALTNANLAVTEAQDASKNAVEQVNPSYENLQTANEQITAVAQEALALREQGVTLQAAFNQALKQVAADYGGLGASADEIKESAKRLVIAQKKAAAKTQEAGDKPVVGADAPVSVSAPSESQDTSNLCECIAKLMEGRGGKGGSKGDSAVSESAKETTQSVDEFGERLNKAGAGLNKLQGSLSTFSSVTIGLAGVYGTLTQSSTELTEEQKRLKLAYSNAFSANIALNAELASLGIEVAASIVATIARARSDFLAKTSIDNLGKAADNAAAKLNQSGGGGGLDFNLLSTKGGKGGKGGGGFRGKLSAAGNQVRGAKIAAQAGGAGKIGANFAAIKKGASIVGGALKTFRGGLAGTILSVGALGLSFFRSADAAGKTAVELEKLAISSEKAQQVADEQLELLQSGGGPRADGKVASEEAFVTAKQTIAKNEVERLRIGQGIEGDQSTLSSVGNIATSILDFTSDITGAAAAVTAFIPGLQLVSGKLAGVSLAAAGASIVIDTVVGLFDDTKERLQALVPIYDAVAAASGGFAKTQFRAIKSVNEFNSSIKAAENANLEGAAKLNVLTSGLDKLQGSFKDTEKTFKDAQFERGKAEAAAQQAGLINAAGQQTKSDDELKQSEKNTLANLDELRKGEQDAAKARQGQLDTILQQEVALRQQSNEAVGAFLNSFEIDFSAGELSNALDGVVDASTLFASGAKGAAEVGAALTAAKDKFVEIQDLKFKDSIEASRKLANTLRGQEDQARTVQKNEAKALELQKKKDAAVKETQRLEEEKAATIAQFEAKQVVSINEQIVAQKQLAVTTLRNELILRREQAARDAFNKTLQTLNKAAEEAAAAFSQFDDSLAIITGQGAGLGSATQVDTSILDAPLEQLSLEQLQAKFDEINNTFAGAQLGPIVTDLQDDILLAKQVSERIPEVLDSFKTGLDSSKQVDIKASVDELLEGIDDTPLGKALKNKVESILDEAGSGPVGVEQQQAVLDEVNSFIERNVELQKRIVDLNNQYAQKLAQSQQAILKSKEKELELGAKIVEKEAQQAEKLAQLSGQEGPSRQDKQDARLRASQVRLTGTGATAGDAASLGDAVTRNLQKAQEQRELAKGDGDQGAREDAANKSREFASAAARAKSELEKLADQSGRLADIEKDLAKTKSATDDAKSLRDKIVFGSDEERQNINRDFQALQIVQQRGSLEGINEEGRAAALRALDTLGSGTFGGQTGDQIRDQLSESTAGRIPGLGNLNKLIQTGEERQAALLQEAANIQQQELDALTALQKLQQQQTADLVAAEQQLSSDFTAAIQNLIDNPPAAPEEDPVNVEIEKQLALAQQDLIAANENLVKSQLDLEIATLGLTAAIEKRDGGKISEGTDKAIREARTKRGSDADVDAGFITKAEKEKRDKAAKEAESVRAAEKASINANAEKRKEDIAAQQQAKQTQQEINEARERDKQREAEAPKETEEQILQKFETPEQTAARQARQKEAAAAKKSSASGTIAGETIPTDTAGKKPLTIREQRRAQMARARERNRAGGRRQRNMQIVQDRNMPTDPSTQARIAQRRQEEQAKAQARKDRKAQRAAEEQRGAEERAKARQGGGSFNIPPSLELGRKADALPASGPTTSGAGTGTDTTSLDEKFTTLGDAMSKLADIFSQPLEMNHTFSGDMTMAFKLENSDGLRQAIAQAMSPTIMDLIRQEVDRVKNEFRSK